MIPIYLDYWKENKIAIKNVRLGPDGSGIG